MGEKRKYTLRERARAQAETRQRIVEATMALHQEVGPRNTTISAIAARAGVQRLTVYRHFPDETAVFQACTSHWLELNPPPADEAWADGSPAAARRAALDAFYGYYRRTQAMWVVSHRDVALVPALQEPMARFASYLDDVAQDVGRDLAPPARATLRHGLDFRTWHGLETLVVEPAAKRDLVLAWIDGAERLGAVAPRGATREIRPI